MHRYASLLVLKATESRRMGKNMLKPMAFSVVHIKKLGFIDIHTPENGICSIGIDPQPYVPILRKKNTSTQARGMLVRSIVTVMLTLPSKIWE